MQKHWKYFLITIKDDKFGFSFVIAKIQTILEYVFDAMLKEVECIK